MKAINEELYREMRTCVLSRFSPIWLFANLWTIVQQAPLSMGFSRQEYWSGLPCPPPGSLPDPIKPVSRVSPTTAGRFFTTRVTWEAPKWRENPCLLTARLNIIKKLFLPSLIYRFNRIKMPVSYFTHVNKT